ncbi:ATP-binding protein [Pseudoalteromonas fenneropenaei]|uniref:histidine kinase n=1 Tax=Pseudoalteromonas fenneropenaei TaxID=1737459 RepID=A0ABV7CIT5_9GAMM
MCRLIVVLLLLCSIPAIADLQQLDAIKLKPREQRITLLEQTLNDAQFTTYPLDYQLSYIRTLANDYRDSGNAQKALPILQQYLATNALHEPQFGYLYLSLAHSYYLLQQYDEAEKTVQLGLSFATEPQHTNLHLLLVNRLGAIYHNTGRYEDAIKLLLNNLPLAEANSNQRYLEGLYSQLGRNLERLTHYQQALEFKLKAFAIAKAIYPEENLASSYYGLGQSYLDLALYPDAKFYFQKSLELDLLKNDPLDIGHSQMKLSFSEFKLGNLESAIIFAEAARGSFITANSARDQAWVELNLSTIYLDKQQLQQAQNALQKAQLYFFAKDAEVNMQSDVWYNLARLRHLSTTPPFSYDELDKAIAIETEHGYITKHIRSLALKQQFAMANQDLSLALEISLQLAAIRQRVHEQAIELQRSIALSTLEHNRKDLTITQLELERIKQQRLVEQQKQQQLLALFVFVIVLLLSLIITAIVFYRRKLEQREKDYLATLMTQKDNLFSDISHDLRTPLTALSLTIEAVECGLMPADSDTFKKLSGKVVTLTTLVEDISELARLNSPDFKLKSEPVNVFAYLEELKDSLSLMVKQHQFTFRNQLGNGLILQLDKSRMTQVLFNLITNSAKYTHAPGQVSFSAEVTERGVYFCIEDTSPGVSDAAIPKLFERLYREDSARSQGKGNGLGLAIVKRIVSLHGGEVWASHSPLGGLKVCIIFPIVN